MRINQLVNCKLHFDFTQSYTFICVYQKKIVSLQRQTEWHGYTHPPY